MLKYRIFMYFLTNTYKYINFYIKYNVFFIYIFILNKIYIKNNVIKSIQLC